MKKLFNTNWLYGFEEDEILCVEVSKFSRSSLFFLFGSYIFFIIKRKNTTFQVKIGRKSNGVGKLRKSPCIIRKTMVPIFKLLKSQKLFP